MDVYTSEPVDWSIPNPGKIKILIVDDEAPLLLLLEKTLINAGYKVIAEQNAENVVSMVICMKPDIILLDVVMPGIDGFTICEQLQKNQQTKSIPVIFLTINGQTDNKIRGLEAGGVDYLIKPLDSNELLARVHRHIEIHWLRRSLEKTINDKESQLQTLKSRLNKTNKFIVQSASPYKKMLSVLDAGIATIDNKFTCIKANYSAAYLLGYDTPDEMIGKKLLVKKHNENNRKTDLRLKNNKFITTTDNKENGLLTKDNKYLPVKMSLKPLDDETAEETAEISFIDISVEKSLTLDFFSPIYKDALTGLINKKAFHGIINHEGTQTSRGNNKCAVFIIDLDYFKEVNDSFGHLVGDQVLCKIAQRLCRFVREQDKVARLGGDEFGLIVNSAGNTDDLEQQATRLLEKIRRPIKLPSARIKLSACIGICLIDSSLPSDTEEIVHRADMALYKAKNDRKKGYCLFEASMLDELEDARILEQELSSLIESNQLYIEYQPQFLLSSGEYIGAEALVRWNHPAKGKLLPISFLTIAEKRGFLRNISNHTLVNVCEQIEKWKTAGVRFGHISVNICAAQLNDANFFDEVCSLLDKHQVEPGDLVLELTETTLFKINNDSRRRLLQFINLGIKFAIDDFGKGYSSMQLLKDMHSDIMKIDKNFVEEIENSEKSRTIIKAIIDLSKSLNMHVTAEGVENVQQLNFLREAGCDSFQGFYQRKSVGPEMLEEDFPRD